MISEYTTERMNPHDLLPHPRNFRRHPEGQRTALRQSLAEFGIVSGPVFNRTTGHLIDGHLRVEEAIRMNLDTMPVSVIEIPAAAERRLLRLYDQIGAMAEIDDGALEALIEEIGDVDLERLLGEIGEPESGLLPEADPDAIPEQVETRCKAGDLWKLGEHRLLCGDSTKREDVERLFARKKASLVWTDPPYGVSYADKNDFLNAMDRGNCNQTPIEGDHMTEVATEELCRASLALACEHSMKGTSVYVACPAGTLLPHFIAAVAASGFQFKHSLVWVKNQFVLGRCDYHYRHEIILYGWKDGAHYFRDDHSQDSVFEIDKPRRSEEHPVMKPVALIQQMIENSSRPTEIVYDPFLGSGSTLLACEAVQRDCYGCELSPGYGDVILARWEQATGRTAERID